MDTEHIERARELYVEKFKGRFALDPELVLTAQHASYILQELDEREARIVLELGCGFSTILLRTWAEKSGARVITGDSDENILKCLEKEYSYKDMHTFRKLKSPSFYEVLKGRCDCVFVDHWTQLYDRIEDIPWIITLVSPTGFIVFTDCRTETNYEKHIKRHANALGFDFSVIEETRTDITSAIGIATRREKTPMNRVS